METNGEIYCDECNLAIMRQQHVRLPRPQTARQTQKFAHFHNRHEGDCWFRVKQKAAVRAAAKRPTVADRAAFDTFLATKGVIQ